MVTTRKAGQRVTDRGAVLQHLNVKGHRTWMQVNSSSQQLSDGQTSLER